MAARPVLLADTAPVFSGLSESNFTMAGPPPALVEWIASQGGHCVWPTNDEFEPEAGLTAELRKTLRPVRVDPQGHDAWLSVITDPFLWFVNHKLWDLSNAPDFRAEEYDYFKLHLDLVRQMADEVVKQAEGAAPVYVFGHRLLMAATYIRRAKSGSKIHLIVPTAWGDPGDFAILPDGFRMALFDALTEADSVTFPTSADARRFLRCCADIYELEVDVHERRVERGETATLVRSLLPPATLEPAQARAETAPVRSLEEELIVTRRQHVMLTVAPLDLSANLLRGLTSFDTLLTNSPRFRHLITYRLLVWAKSEEIPEYAEYRERLEALVAVVNHRHGATDWMPVDQMIFFDIDQILADLRQFDLFFLPALKEGANALPQMAAALNRRNGVLALSTGAAACARFAPAALSFNPFDIKEISEKMQDGLELSDEERAHRAAELRVSANEVSPDDWLHAQSSD